MVQKRFCTILSTTAALAFLSSLSWSAGCGGKSASTTQPPDPCAGDACAGTGANAATADQPVDISDWAQWTRINAVPVRSGGHGDQWVTVYVSSEHADAYRNLSSAAGGMARGMKLAKVVHQDLGSSAGDVKAITVMVKMPEGYDNEGGDWYYGVYDATGRTAKMHGKLDKCKGCHESYADSDYLGGMPK